MQKAAVKLPPRQDAISSGRQSRPCKTRLVTRSAGISIATPSSKDIDVIAVPSRVSPPSLSVGGGAQHACPVYRGEEVECL